MSDLAAARACYEKALELDPHQAGTMWNLALVLEQQNERNWAEKLYDKIPEDAPEWCDACFPPGLSAPAARRLMQAARRRSRTCLAQRGPNGRKPA